MFGGFGRASINMADQDPVAWNVDLEVSLFHAMKKHKPVGVNRHFQMAFIYNILNSSINRKISSKEIWEKLNTLYDLRALNESEISPFPNKQVDFSLPETEFSTLITKVVSSNKSPIARHEHVKDPQKEKEPVKEKEGHKEKDRDRESHKEKDSHKDNRERHRDKDKDSSKDSHKDKESHKEKDRDSHKHDKERESLRDKHEREKESKKSDKKSRKDKDRHGDRDNSKSKRKRDRDSSPKGSRKRTRNLPDPSPKLKEEGGPTPKRARRI